MRVLPNRLEPRGDEGFSLVETVVALTIAALAFSTLSLALISSVHSSVLSQQNQQAGDLLSQSVERSRALGYDSLAMRATDLNTGEAPRTPSISSCLCYDPKADSTSGAGVEPLAATDPVGGVFPHVSPVLQNGLTYTIRRYVTAPVDAFGATYKRLTVFIAWDSLGKSHARSYSTIITATRRGLPLPDYKFTATGGGLSQCRNPGSEAVYSFTLKNNGARDAWNLAATGSGTWSFYGDTNADGVYSTGDVSLTSGGATSTGLIEPTGSRNFFAVATIPAAIVTPPPYVWSTTFRATSAAQPGFFSDLTTTTSVQAAACGGVPSPTPSATPSPTATATAAPIAPAQPAPSCTSLTGAVSPSAPGGTAVRYYFRNPSQPGNTNAAIDMPVTRDGGTPPALGSLYAYSQDIVASAGRYVEQGTSSAVRELASWTYQMPATSTLKGDGSLTFYATVASGVTTAAPAFTVKLELLGTDGVTVKSTFVSGATYSTPSAGWGCAGFRPVSLAFGTWGGSGTDVAANEKLRVTLRVTNSVPVLLAYGTAAYPTEMQLPYKAGLG